MDTKRKIVTPADPLRAVARHPRPQRSRARRTAFTIVEMLIVLLVMGILAATATPSFFRSLRHHQLESAARRVKLDVEQARHAARLKSESQSITFTGPTGYTLSSGVAGMNSAAETYAVDLAKAPYDLESITLNLGGPTAISFDGYGTASVGGTIVLAAGDETRTITLDNSNGDVTISNP
jgi:prepilin-type N-terminal cleavage/methylation domain-containing protein